MINPNYNLSDLKAALYDAFSKTEVSKTVCIGVRPGATKGIDDFMVIRVISDLVDWNAYGKVVCRVELYARDIYQSENADKLKDMFLKSKEALKELNSNERYWFSFISISDRGSDGLDFHSTSFDLKAFVKIN